MNVCVYLSVCVCVKAGERMPLQMGEGVGSDMAPQMGGWGPGTEV